MLNLLDELLEQPVELTLYGRAELSFGLPDSPDEYAWSRQSDKREFLTCRKYAKIRACIAMAD